MEMEFLDDVNIFDALRYEFEGSDAFDRADAFDVLGVDLESKKPTAPVEDGFKVQYPDSWQKMDMNEQDFTHYVLCELPISSDEFVKVYETIMSRDRPDGVQVCQIHRIQNPFRWRRYQTFRTEIARRGECNEAVLFHGTCHGAATSIFQTGFNRSYCGKNGKFFGEGIYFSKNFSYSCHPKYSVPDADGFQYIIMSKVLVGLSGLGSPGIKTPPKGCDSACDDANNIFVTFHDDQAYPEYLVKYRVVGEAAAAAGAVSLSTQTLQPSSMPCFWSVLPNGNIAPLLRPSGPSVAKIQNILYYIPSAVYSGSKPAYVFMMGLHGIGYYLDIPLTSHNEAALRTLQAFSVLVSTKRWGGIASLASVRRVPVLFWDHPDPKQKGFLSPDIKVVTVTAPGKVPDDSDWQGIPWVSNSPASASAAASTRKRKRS